MTNTIKSEIEFTLTKHAQIRMQQRAFSQSDLHSIAMCGTAINNHEILFTIKDAKRERSEVQNRLKQLLRQSQQGCGSKPSGNEFQIAQEISSLKRELTNIDRLINRKIVIDGNQVITCYRCSKSELKRISRIIN